MPHAGKSAPEKYLDQSKSVVRLATGAWVGIGATTRVETAGVAWTTVSETPTEGPHWVRQSVKLAHPAGSVQIVVRIFGGSASGVRLRLASGDDGASKSCWISLADHSVVQTDFRNTELFKAGPDDGSTLSFEEKIEDNITDLDIGIMLFDQDRKTVYAGQGKTLRIGGCFLTLFQASSDRSRHDRTDPFGRTAYRLCKGRGLEIGALHKPFDLDAHVTYLDYEKTAVLRHHYRSDARVDTIGQVQIVWRGNRYPFFDDNAFDFVINSHVLEHTCNPGRMIEEWLRIIRPAGILYMVIPDKRHTFDRPRKLTSVADMVEEYKSNNEIIPLASYEDYFMNSEQKLSSDEGHIKSCYEAQSSIHAHTFTAASMLEFAQALQAFFPFEICHFESAGMHIHLALRKS